MTTRSRLILRPAAAAVLAGMCFSSAALAGDDAPAQLEDSRLSPAYLMAQTRPATRAADRTTTGDAGIGAFFNSPEDGDYAKGSDEGGIGMFQTDLGGVVQGPHTPRFGIYSDDGRFVMRPMLLLQLQGVITSVEDVNEDRETDIGAEVARARFGVDGRAFSQDLYYRVTADVGSVFGGFELEDAFIAFPLSAVSDRGDRMGDDGPQLALRVGQFKAPFGHGFLVDESRALSAAYTEPLSELLLGGMRIGRVQGVSLLIGPTHPNAGMGDGDEERRWRAEVALYDGANTANTDFTDTDFGAAARVEFLAQGDTWDNYRDYTALGTEEDTIVVGLGGTWNQDGDTDFRAVTGDIQFESEAGMGFYGALFVAPERIDGNDGTNFGAMGQVAYLLDNAWEPFGRLDILVIDDEFIPVGEDTFFQITGGLNRYLGDGGRWGHGAKFTVDLSILPNGGVAYPRDADLNASEEWMAIFRAQIQFAL